MPPFDGVPSSWSCLFLDQYHSYFRAASWRNSAQQLSLQKAADKRALSTFAKMEHHKLIYTEIELNCWIKNLNPLKMPLQRLCLFDQTKKNYQSVLAGLEF